MTKSNEADPSGKSPADTGRVDLWVTLRYSTTCASPFGSCERLLPLPPALAILNALAAARRSCTRAAAFPGPRRGIALTMYDQIELQEREERQNVAEALPRKRNGRK